MARQQLRDVPQHYARIARSVRRYARNRAAQYAGAEINVHNMRAIRVALTRVAQLRCCVLSGAQKDESACHARL